MNKALLILALICTYTYSFSQGGLEADFTISPPSGTAGTGEDITFTNNTTLGTCGAATYSWNFGAGANPATITGVGPHTVQYTVSGTKTITLTVTQAPSIPGCVGGANDQVQKSYTINGLLPVEMLAFNVSAQNKFPLLTWSTASELNNDYFVLSRSKDGKSFEEIAKVNGNGTSGLLNQYSYLDKTLLRHKAYYRLSQVDFNGTSRQAGFISFAPENIQHATLYPNPAEQFTTLELYADNNGEVLVEVINLLGQQMQVSAFETFKGLNSYQLDLSGLPVGYYQVRVVHDSMPVNLLISLK